MQATAMLLAIAALVADVSAMTVESTVDALKTMDAPVFLQVRVCAHTAHNTAPSTLPAAAHSCQDRLTPYRLSHSIRARATRSLSSPSAKRGSRVR